MLDAKQIEQQSRIVNPGLDHATRFVHTQTRGNNELEQVVGDCPGRRFYLEHLVMRVTFGRPTNFAVFWAQPQIQKADLPQTVFQARNWANKNNMIDLVFFGLGVTLFQFHTESRGIPAGVTQDKGYKLCIIDNGSNGPSDVTWDLQLSRYPWHKENYSI